MQHEYIDKLIARAQRDEDFRAKLVSDPRAAVPPLGDWTAGA